MKRVTVAVALVALAGCNPIRFFFGEATESGDDASVTAAPLTADPACPSVRGPTSEGHLVTSIDEASGIAASTVNPSIYWTHNDSGDSARAFAVNARGELVETVSFDTVKPIDIEDMSIEDTPNGGRLYFADIGDNAASRPDVVLLRFPEPRVSSDTPEVVVTSEKMRVRYPDGPRDAETLLLDPSTKELFIVSKVLFGNAGVYRVGPFEPGGSVTAKKIATVALPLATAGAISRDGKRVGLRNYTTTGMLWNRQPNEDLAVMFGRPPCPIPIARATLGEAFAFLPDGSGYVTTSEGKGASLDVARFE